MPIVAWQTLAITFALIGTNYAQTYTACDPTNVTCPLTPGLNSNYYFIDFTKVTSQPSDWTVPTWCRVTYNTKGRNNGAELEFLERYDSQQLYSDFYFLFGRIEFVVQAAPGPGIISDMMTLSDDLDELDWEFRGTLDDEVQTGWFGKGVTGLYNHSVTPKIPTPMTQFHTYSFDWTPDRVVWGDDGAVVRTLYASDCVGTANQYPQTPMKAMLGLWDAGDPDHYDPWSAAMTTFPLPEGGYSFYVRSVKIWNSNPAACYNWTDHIGSWQSIKGLNDTSACGLSPTSSSTLISPTSNTPIPSSATSASSKTSTSLPTTSTMANLTSISSTTSFSSKLTSSLSNTSSLPKMTSSSSVTSSLSVLTSVSATTSSPSTKTMPTSSITVFSSLISSSSMNIASSHSTLSSSSSQLSTGIHSSSAQTSANSSSASHMPSSPSSSTPLPSTQSGPMQSSNLHPTNSSTLTPLNASTTALATASSSPLLSSTTTHTLLSSQTTGVQSSGHSISVATISSNSTTTQTSTGSARTSNPVNPTSSTASSTTSHTSPAQTGMSSAQIPSTHTTAATSSSTSIVKTSPLSSSATSPTITGSTPNTKSQPLTVSGRNTLTIVLELPGHQTLSYNPVVENLSELIASLEKLMYDRKVERDLAGLPSESTDLTSQTSLPHLGLDRREHGHMHDQLHEQHRARAMASRTQVIITGGGGFNEADGFFVGLDTAIASPTTSPADQSAKAGTNPAAPSDEQYPPPEIATDEVADPKSPLAQRSAKPQDTEVLSDAVGASSAATHAGETLNARHESAAAKQALPIGLLGVYLWVTICNFWIYAIVLH